MTENRIPDRLRNIRITPDFTEMATGSALIECGRTRVLCTVSIENGVPPFKKGTGEGWLTAEYAMLPGSTPQRKQRETLKRDGRSVEIQRLIGRSLRAACDLTKIGERTVYVDCDVLQADGGTRTASITGAFVALCIACDRFVQNGVFYDSPVRRSVAAVSVGIVDSQPVLDLEYKEDSRAQVDMNVVMTMNADGEMEFVEVQGTGEGRPFTKPELQSMLTLAEGGARALMAHQRAALGARAAVIGKKEKLILASGNFGKLRELRALMADRYDVISMREIGVEDDIEETGATFEQNAKIKAETVMRLTGCAALADDSGLRVDALGGRPGVLSARYAGVHGDDEANNDKLLRDLEFVPEPRAARFTCAIALARPGRETLIATGDSEGEILTERRGEGGFGYDALFFSPALGKTFAQASMEEKGRVSHRAVALHALMESLTAEDVHA